MARDLQAMLERRRRLVAVWPKLAAVLILLTVGFFVFLFIAQPLLVNPAHVLTQLEAGTLDSATLALLATMAPMLLLTVGVLLILLILFVTAGMINERRLLGLIDENALIRKGQNKGA